MMAIRGGVPLLQKAGFWCEVRAPAPAGMSCGAADETASRARVRPIIHFSLLTTTALGGTIAAALLWAASPAQAACAPIANGAGIPAAGTTVTCSGATVDQNGADGYGDGNQDGLTVNVQSGASVAGTDSGIRLRDNNTVQNSGSISAFQRYGVRADNGSITVTNNVGATITGDQVGVFAEGNATVNNSGTITGTAVLQALGVGVQSYGLINITNNAGGFITGTAWGVMSVNDGGTVNNYGTITATGAYGNAAAVYVQGTGSLLVNNYSGGVLTGYANGVSGGGPVTVNNWGTITGGTGPAIYGDNVVVTNNAGGSITGGASGGIQGGSSATVDNSGAISSTDVNGAAVQVYGGPVNVTNRAGGTIQGLITASGDVTVVNSGSIVAPLAIFTSAGSVNLTNNAGGSIQSSFDALEAGGPVTVVNSGTITATRFAINGDVAATVTNNVGGAIQGGTAAVWAHGVQISNFGTLSGDTGIISLPGASSNILNAGTITGTGGTAIQLSGAGNTLTVTPTSVINGLVIGSGSDTFQLGGSGTGAFNVGNIGAGQQYDGFTTFNKIGDSTWFLSGTGAQTWNVLSGTLAGNATIGGLNVASGGTVAPGASIGTINVNGNVSFGPGSTYQVEVNSAGQSDRIAATGTATLTGGTVQTRVLNNGFGPSTTYTILTATGGRTGTFANVVDGGSAFLTPSLSYTGQSVLLTLTRSALFSSVAQTPNQLAVANATQNDSGAVGTALVRLSSPADARRAFDSLSGEIHADVQTTLLEDSRFIRQAMLGRLRQIPYLGETGAMAALGSGGPALAFAAETAAADARDVLAYAGRAKPGFPTKALPVSVPSGGYTFWAQGIGAWGRFGSDGNAATINRSLGGFVSGFDARFGGNWNAGLVTGYSQSNANVNDRASSARIDTAYAGAYAGTSVGAWNLRSGAAYAFHSIDSNRAIAFPGFNDQTLARYHGGTGQVFGEIGYGKALGPVSVEPFAGLTYVRVNTQAFAETGGAAALTGTGNTESVGYSSLGMRLATNQLLPNGMMLTPRASLAWQHSFGDVTPAAALAFASTGTGFTIAGVPLARDAALIDAGADLRISPHGKVGVSYSGQLSGRIQDHAVKGNLIWNF